ncbi:ankyrin repeat domain-containing protein [Flavobacterium microcysteis]
MKKLLSLLFLVTVSAMAQNKGPKDVFDTARYGTVEEIKALAAKNPDTINKVNAMGFTPLILACYRGNLPVAEYLTDNAKNINYSSSSGTALAAVAVKGNIKLAEALLKKKADPNIADPAGMTPLLYAIQFKNKELIELLLRYKADKTQKDKQGKAPFEYAIDTRNQEIINLFKN